MNTLRLVTRRLANKMATFTADPPWTPVRCPGEKCQWRGPLAKSQKDCNDLARCPKCLKPVVKVAK